MSGFALSSCKKTEGNEGHVHTESAVISKDATCTETGSKHIECTVCGEVLQTEEIPALGHAWGEWIVDKAATCTEDGTEKRICANDPSHEETRGTSALGHNYVDGVCTRCDEIDPDYIGDDEYTEGLEFTLNNAGTEYSVTGYTGSIASVVIPAKYYSLPVRSIGEHAFYDCSSLTSIVIPSSVTSIGNSAFNSCSSLTSIVIPSSVTSIGSYAFKGCSSLTSIEVAPENGSYCSIDGNLYNKDGKTLIRYAIGKTATEFVVPSSVTSIGEGAFEYCSNLTSVSFGENSQLTSIGNGAFYGCSSLTSVSFGENNQLTSIGEDAFAWCSRLTSIVIPSSVTSIGDRAFSSCSSLTSIEIPSSVTSIGDWAFYNCSSLTSIVIPSSVTSIGDWAFEYCNSLTIYCEAESQPAGWDSDWNPDNRPVVWGYKKTN